MTEQVKICYFLFALNTVKSDPKIIAIYFSKFQSIFLIQLVCPLINHRDTIQNALQRVYHIEPSHLVQYFTKFS